jgi:hypothetical protein
MLHLVLETYYGENTFKLLRSQFTASGPGIFRLPNTAIGHHIRRLEVVIKMNHDCYTKGSLIWTQFVENGGVEVGDILTLARLRDDSICDFKNMDVHGPAYYLKSNSPEFRYKRDPRQHSRFVSGKLWTRFFDDQPGSPTHWQKYFTGLKELKIVLEIDGCMSNSARKALEEFAEQAVISLRAGKTEIVGAVKGCAEGVGRWAKYDGCDGKCADFIERAVVRIMEN